MSRRPRLRALGTTSGSDGSIRWFAGKRLVANRNEPSNGRSVRSTDRASVRLPTRWLAFGRVGFVGCRRRTHWVTMTSFKGRHPYSIVPGFSRHDHRFVRLTIIATISSLVAQSHALCPHTAQPKAALGTVNQRERSHRRWARPMGDPFSFLFYSQGSRRSTMIWHHADRKSTRLNSS